MEYETYVEDLKNLSLSYGPTTIRRQRELGARISWLNKKQAMGLVAATAERNWSFVRHLYRADPLNPLNNPPVPFNMEVESWVRESLDVMWEHITDGIPLDNSALDPRVFSDSRWLYQIDLITTLKATFNFAISRGSAEQAVDTATRYQGSNLHARTKEYEEFKEYRLAWHEKTFPNSYIRFLANDELHVISNSNPLQLVPYSWVERDIGLLKTANPDTTFEGLRELAVNDVQVGLDLKLKMSKVAMPSTGAMTADVWSADIRSMVKTAIEETLKQTMPTQDS